MRIRLAFMFLSVLYFWFQPFLWIYWMDLRSVTFKKCNLMQSFRVMGIVVKCLHDMKTYCRINVIGFGECVILFLSMFSILNFNFGEKKNPECFLFAWNFRRQKHRILWRICKVFIHINTFVYQNKRIYIEQDDKYQVYSVKVLRPNAIAMKVPIRNWTRLKTIPINSKIIQQALQIREKYFIKKYRGDRDDNNELDRGYRTSRLTRMEKSLKTIEKNLKKLNDRMKRSWTNSSRQLWNFLVITFIFRWIPLG